MHNRLRKRVRRLHRRLAAYFIIGPGFDEGHICLTLRIQLWNPLFWLWLYWPSEFGLGL